MAFPKIIFNGTTLAFSFPPVQKSGTLDREIDRRDSIALSGVKQSIFVRSDKFFPLQMDYVDIAGDLPAWDAFLDYAETGATFDYYPDADVDAFTTYTLEDTSFNPAFAFFGTAKFKLKFRRAV